jgi:hypothetical protein
MGVNAFSIDISRMSLRKQSQADTKPFLSLIEVDSTVNQSSELPSAEASSMNTAILTTNIFNRVRYASRYLLNDNLSHDCACQLKPSWRTSQIRDDLRLALLQSAVHEAFHSVLISEVERSQAKTVKFSQHLK